MITKLNYTWLSSVEKKIIHLCLKGINVERCSPMEYTSDSAEVWEFQGDDKGVVFWVMKV